MVDVAVVDGAVVVVGAVGFAEVSVVALVVVVGEFVVDAGVTRAVDEGDPDVDVMLPQPTSASTAIAAMAPRRHLFDGLNEFFMAAPRSEMMISVSARAENCEPSFPSWRLAALTLPLR